MCAMLLADLGATVLRIDRLEPVDLGNPRPLKYNLLLRNRKAIALDLKNKESVDLVLRLVAKADALIEGFRPGVTERLVLYNPIGLVDGRYDRPWDSTDESYKRTLASTYQSIRASIMRYVAHNPSAWTPEFETYTRVRYAWTLGADWPRLVAPV